MRDFKLLKVWEKAHRLTLAVYKASAAFPKAELFGFVPFTVMPNRLNG